MRTRVRQQTSRLAEIIFRRYLHAKRIVRNVDLAKFALLMRKTAEASGFALILSAKFMAFGDRIGVSVKQVGVAQCPTPRPKICNSHRRSCELGD
jgi:hypothetical protein